MIAEIPLIPDQANEFVVQFGNVKYTLYMKFNERSLTWTMDIKETVSGLILLQGLALVLGQELLQPYNLNIGKMMLTDERESGVEAGASDFDTNSKLFWFSNDEIIV